MWIKATYEKITLIKLLKVRSFSRLTRKESYGKTSDSNEKMVCDRREPCGNFPASLGKIRQNVVEISSFERTLNGKEKRMPLSYQVQVCEEVSLRFDCSKFIGFENELSQFKKM